MRKEEKMTAKPTASSWRRSAASCSSFLMLILLCALSMLALSSCATGTKPTLAPGPNPPPPSLPANLVQECPEVPPARNSSLQALGENHDEAMAIYHDCRSSKTRLIAATREWEATAWQWYCTAAKRIGIDVDGCPPK